MFFQMRQIKLLPFPFKYEKSSVEQDESVSSILGPVTFKKVSDINENCKSDLCAIDEDVKSRVNFENSVFNNCNVTFWVKKD